jgi:hypothetical protein
MRFSRRSRGRQYREWRARRTESAKVNRGSRRRLKQLKPRGNGSAELWLIIGWVAFLVFVVLPWMIRQGH